MSEEVTEWTESPSDPKRSAWNAKREEKLARLHVEAKTYPIKVTVTDDVFPRPHEVYNCTTCKRGREQLQFPKDENNYKYYCKWRMATVDGPKYKDMGCEFWDRKILKPHKGYNEHETGPSLPWGRR